MVMVIVLLGISHGCAAPSPPATAADGEPESMTGGPTPDASSTSEAARPARVTVYSKPKGTVVIDGEATGETTPVTVEFEPGTAQVQVRWGEDAISEKKKVRGESGQRIKLFYRKPAHLESASDSDQEDDGESEDELACSTEDGRTKYSCPFYRPGCNMVVGAQAKHRAFHTGGSSASSALMVYHARYHLEQWGDRIEGFRRVEETDQMSRSEVVREIQRRRMKRAGSMEAFVEQRLSEERAAVSFAREKVFAEDASKPSWPALSDEATSHHRDKTRQQVRQMKQAHPSLFDED
jgi:hypothetical protein